MSVFSILTLGCKVNQYETEELIENLTAAGLVFERVARDCDLVVVNGCAVTVEAEAKSRKQISRALRENPQALLVHTGCLTGLGTGAPGWDGSGKVLVERDKAKVVTAVLSRLRVEQESARPRPGQPFRSRRLLKIQD